MPTTVGVDNIPVPLAAEAPDGPGAFVALANVLTQVRGGLVVADLNALVLLSAVTFEGRIVHIDAMGCNFQAQDGVWMQIDRARFVSTADRDAEYANAGTAYRVNGAECYITSTDALQIRRTGVWRNIGLDGGDHGEYTLLANAAVSNVAFVTGTVTVDPSLTLRDPVSATGSGTITLADAGVYLIEFYASMGATVTGRTYLALKIGATTLARSTIGTGEDQGFVAATVYRAAAGVVIGAEFLKNTGGTSNVSGRIRVTRLDS